MESSIPNECVGPESDQAGYADACQGCPNQAKCASGEMKKPNPEQAVVDMKLSTISRILLVLSGKGGVGKSTVSTQLAFSLARKGKRVGLLDLDICGPSIPLMMGLKGSEVHQSASGWSPVYVDIDTDEDIEIGVMSIGFLMSNQDSAVIWRGPRKNGLIQQFFTSVDWGELDYLVIDTPPGTSDEHISIVQLLKSSLKENDGALIVTTPQEVSMMDVRKELNFCKKTNIPVLGIIENMSTMHLPLSNLCIVGNDGIDQSKYFMTTIQQKCPELLNFSVKLSIFPPDGNGPSGMAKQFNVPFLGAVPLDVILQQAGEKGKPICTGDAYKYFERIIDKILASEENNI